MTEWNVETALNHHAACSVYDDGACTCGLRARREQIERSPLAPGEGTWSVFAEKVVAERDAAREEVERLRKDHERSIDWYQQRFNRLRRWVKEEVEPLSEDVARRYFAICANGSPSPHESADWRETMHGLSLERDSLRAENERLRAACTLALGVMEQKNKVNVPPMAKFITVTFAPEDVAVLRAALEKKP